MATANPTISLVFFTIVTILYFILKYFSKNAQTQKIWGVIYILLIIFGEYNINLMLTKDLCGTNQYNVAMLVTLVPWLLIFGILNVILMVFPGWLSPFSNTFGYLVTKISGVGSFFNDILTPKIESKKGGKEIFAALEHIYNDKSLLINELTLNNLPDFWNNMQKGGLIKKDAGSDKSDNYNKLKGFIELKDDVATFVWYILTGALVTSAGYNYIVNTGCKQSVAEMQKRHAEYEEQVKQEQETKDNAPPQRIYKSYE